MLLHRQVVLIDVPQQNSVPEVFEHSLSVLLPVQQLLPILFPNEEALCFAASTECLRVVFNPINKLRPRLKAHLEKPDGVPRRKRERKMKRLFRLYMLLNSLFSRGQVDYFILQEELLVIVS